MTAAYPEVSEGRTSYELSCRVQVMIPDNSRYSYPIPGSHVGLMHRKNDEDSESQHYMIIAINHTK